MITHGNPLPPPPLGVVLDESAITTVDQQHDGFLRCLQRQRTVTYFIFFFLTHLGKSFLLPIGHEDRVIAMAKGSARRPDEVTLDLAGVVLPRRRLGGGCRSGQHSGRGDP